MATNKQDALAGVRTKKGKTLANPLAKGGPKVNAKEAKGYGVDKTVPKTPTKANSVASIMSDFQYGAKNKY